MMAGQLTAAGTITYASLLHRPSLPNKDLINQRRRVSFNGKKKNLAITALAGKSVKPIIAVSSPRLTAVSSPRLTAVSSPRLTAVSSPFFTDNHGNLSLSSVPMSRRHSSSIRPEAYLYHRSGFRIPANAEKPEWWWRTLSCIPYLIALQMSAVGYYLQPLNENLIFYIPTSINQLPTWFPFLYSSLAIELLVKNRDFPLILRFHVMMGMLLETAFQIVWVASNYMPLIHVKGTLGMYYWAGVALAYIVIIMHSIRCALLGTFSNIPVISESALIHSLFNIGGFQWRPF